MLKGHQGLAHNVECLKMKEIVDLMGGGLPRWKSSWYLMNIHAIKLKKKSLQIMKNVSYNMMIDRECP